MKCTSIWWHHKIAGETTAWVGHHFRLVNLPGTLCIYRIIWAITTGWGHSYNKSCQIKANDRNSNESSSHSYTPQIFCSCKQTKTLWCLSQTQWQSVKVTVCDCLHAELKTHKAWRATHWHCQSFGQCWPMWKESQTQKKYINWNKS